MAEFPALPLWTDALIGDTFHLTPAEFGAYLRLLICAWRTAECALPDNDASLGRMIGDPKNWHRLRGTVIAFFHKGEDGLFRQKRLSDEREYVSRQAAKSSAGGKAKALKNRKHRSAKPMPKECLNGAPTPTPTPTEVSSLRSDLAADAADKPKRKNKRSIPDHFPLKQDLDWANYLWVQKGRVDLANTVEDEIRKFRDHHSSKATSSADWPASWRTWATNAIKFNNGGHNGRSQPRKSAHSNQLEGSAELLREIARMENGSFGDFEQTSPPLLEARLLSKPV